MVSPSSPSAKDLINKAFDSALSLYDQDRFDDATHVISQILVHDPAYAPAYLMMGKIARRLKHNESAIKALLKAQSLDPNNLEIDEHLGGAYYIDSQYEKAIPHLKKVIEHPEGDHFASLIANCYNFMGKSAEAKEYFELSYQKKPADIAHLSDYVIHCAPIKDKNDPLFAELLSHEEDTDQREDTLIAHILASSYYYALYRTHEGLKDYDLAFESLNKMNKAMKQRYFHYTGSNYGDDKPTFTQHLKIERAFYTPQCIQDLKRKADMITHDERPVFILGLPRTGTTLLEQILHAHPKVKGVGEHSFLQKKLIHCPPQDRANFKFAHEYCDDIAKIHPTAERIVNKSISSFYYAGYIATAMPHAKLIHISRNPLDSSLSAYSRHFVNANHPHTYDLEQLGIYFREYKSLMDYWDEIFPGRILHLSYEDLIEDTQTHARAIIDHIGLEWDDQCLAFYKNQSTVKTASVNQVRKPIYKTSVAKWKPYAEHLEPLIEALGEYAPEEAKGYLD